MLLQILLVYGTPDMGPVLWAVKKSEEGWRCAPQRLKPDMFITLMYGLKLAAARQPVSFRS
jgi:hypothetical protein